VAHVPLPRCHGFLAGKDEERHGELQQALDDPTIRMVLAARGGYGAMRLLEHLNYSGLSSTRKLIVGSSDITALLCDVVLRVGLMSVHGPMVEQIPQADAETLERLLAAMEGRFPPITNLEVLHPGEAEGPILGGNLTVLCHLVGTPFLPRMSGAILFLEDVTESPYRIDRALRHLLLARVLDGVAAVLLGEFRECGDQAEVREVLTENFSCLGIPVLYGLPVGHGPRNFALPFGGIGQVIASASGKGVLRFEPLDQGS